MICTTSGSTINLTDGSVVVDVVALIVVVVVDRLVMHASN
jgi:hypothetical protein